MYFIDQWIIIWILLWKCCRNIKYEILKPQQQQQQQQQDFVCAFIYFWIYIYKLYEGNSEMNVLINWCPLNRMECGKEREQLGMEWDDSWPWTCTCSHIIMCDLWVGSRSMGASHHNGGWRWPGGGREVAGRWPGGGWISADLSLPLPLDGAGLMPAGKCGLVPWGRTHTLPEHSDGRVGFENPTRRWRRWRRWRSRRRFHSTYTLLNVDLSGWRLSRHVYHLIFELVSHSSHSSFWWWGLIDQRICSASEVGLNRLLIELDYFSSIIWWCDGVPSAMASRQRWPRRRCHSNSLAKSQFQHLNFDIWYNVIGSVFSSTDHLDGRQLFIVILLTDLVLKWGRFRRGKLRVAMSNFALSTFKFKYFISFDWPDFCTSY